MMVIEFTTLCSELGLYSRSLDPQLCADIENSGFYDFTRYGSNALLVYYTAKIYALSELNTLEEDFFEEVFHGLKNDTLYTLHYIPHCIVKRLSEYDGS